MKNIHIIPTDQPSRLWIDTITGKLVLDKEPNTLHNQYIYITSDEELPYDDSIFATGAFYHRDAAKDIHIITKDTFYPNPNFCSRIILTTDDSLFKYGVQAIDDEFLEWFVKNPTCEFVEVEKGYLGMAGFIKSNELISKDKLIYKIIIPQEEPKQEILPEFTLSKSVFDKISGLSKQEQQKQHLINMMHDDEELGLYEEPKQETKCYCGHTTYCDCGPLEEPKETLEEAAERLLKDKYGIFISKDAEVKGQLVIDTARAAFLSGMTEGANWQAKRMYTEDEVRDLIIKALTHNDHDLCGSLVTQDNEIRTANFGVWFEHNKKDL